LYFIHDRAEICVEAGMKDFPEMFQVEPLSSCRVGDTNPGNVSLTDMLDTGGAIDEVMYLALEDRLEIFLHLASSYLHDDTHVHMPLGWNFIETRTDHSNSTIDDFFKIGHV
jgi:hypothetical protein